ncbi:DMT family transporter [Ideonella sp.]|uniref:DMT family transporter n=1 Tax=Ideonella sp. TaxID=1929293 RepID=UPI002B45FEA8|nr:DMT family transporter [Ideonella sp.]HJV71195.1 DMT family transporter [Ideonella sp.]
MSLPAAGKLPRQHPLLGVTLIALAATCFATMDSGSRYLGGYLPVLLFFWARYAFQATVMALWLGLRGDSTAPPGNVFDVSAPRGGQGTRERPFVSLAAFSTSHPRFQAIRGALLAATSAMSFYGVQHMPVPEFTAINMLTPLLVIVLAGWWLHEKVSPLRWALVGGGFAGALIVIRPGSGVFGWAVLFPLAGAFTYASFQVLTRRLSGHESPYATHFYTGLTGTLILTPFLLASPIPVLDTLRAAPTWQIGVMLSIGALGTVGHLLLILALGMAPTATLMPFVYLQIAVATVIGWLVFRQVPDAVAFVGMGVIAACGAAGAWLNVRSAPRPTDPVVADTMAD